MHIRNLVFCCILSSAPILSTAQTSPTAQQTASSIVPPASLINDDLPSAPEPSEELAQAAQQSQPAQTKPGNPPSLSDLGFTSQQTQANAQLQAMLDRRTHMLKVHQRLGVITLIPMAATVITGPMVKAKGKNGEPITEPSQTNLDFHAALGGVTTGLYFTTAYYAMFAPKVPDTKRRGAIRYHEALAFIHGPE